MILRQEFQKIIRHPMLWGLFVLCLLLNGLLIWTNVGEQTEELSSAYDAILSEQIDEAYYKQSLSRYDGLDMVEIKNVKQEMYRYYPTGSYKEFIDTRYEKLNERVEEIVASGEAEELVYPGEIYRLHKKLYVNILRWVFLEMGVFVIFSVLYLMDYERLQRTTQVVYSSAVGRNLQWKKWCVGTITGLVFGGGVLMLTLAVWFGLIPYKEFWSTSVSAALISEPRGILFYPFITFYKMNTVQYLFGTILVGIGLVIVLAMIAGSLQLFFKNSYVSFVVIVLLLMSGLWISGYSTATWLDIVLTWNPAAMWYTMGNYFMEGSLSGNYKGAEVLGLAAQFTICGSIGGLAYRNFLKNDNG